MRLDSKQLMILLAVFVFLMAGVASAQTTGFTYQGRLTDGGTPANGDYDLQFSLFDSASGGTQIGSQTIPTVTVSAGIFTVQLDFGPNAFPGPSRWLEISARLSGAPVFTLLTPRQQITSTPYAVRSLNASTADTVVVSGVPPGSGNYIQNGNSPQSANFAITGDGLAGRFSASVVNTQSVYNLGNGRALGYLGTNHLVVGLNAGPVSSTGIDNTFVGSFAGNNATAGDANSFFGVSSGFNNRGTANSFYGRSAGFQNTTGNQNSFFGVQAGRDNSTGVNNSLFGYQAGIGNNGTNNSFFGSGSGRVNTGNGNAFFGEEAGRVNSTGGSGAFFGRDSGYNNTTGFGNVFIGEGAGFANSTGSDNAFLGRATGQGHGEGSSVTLLGSFANVGSSALNHATAVGADAVVTASNRVQIGRVGIDTVAIGAFALGATSTHVCITSQGVLVACTGGGQPEFESAKDQQLTDDLVKALADQKQEIADLRGELEALRRELRAQQNNQLRRVNRTAVMPSKETLSRQR